MKKTMDDVLMLDGISFPGLQIPEDGIKRKFQVLDRPETNRTNDGVLHRSIIGTYYGYVLTINSDLSSKEDYDRFYEIISEPVESHLLKVPYGQGTIEFRAYVTSGEDTVHTMRDGTEWKELQIEFVAKSPYRRAL